MFQKKRLILFLVILILFSSIIYADEPKKLDLTSITGNAIGYWCTFNTACDCGSHCYAYCNKVLVWAGFCAFDYCGPGYEKTGTGTGTGCIKTGCTSECSPGQTQCISAVDYQECIDHDNNGCYEWWGDYQYGQDSTAIFASTCSYGCDINTNRCNSAPPIINTYSWDTGAYNACSKPCGGGTQTRTVYCKNDQTGARADGKCAGTAPASTKPCNTQLCTTGQACSSDSECSSGYCHPGTSTCENACTPNTYKRCASDGNIHSYDSCDNEGSISEPCSYGCDINTNRCNQGPINGRCDTALNSCAVGEFRDISDTETMYNWYCLGLYNGDTALCSICKDVTWSPDPSTVCYNQQVPQTSNCGRKRNVQGTKQDTIWSPDPSTVCSGQRFPQTGDCGGTKYSTGKKNCQQGQTCDISTNNCIVKCTDECFPSEKKECSNNFKKYRTCGDYNNDGCLEWDDYNTYCNEGYMCESEGQNNVRCVPRVTKKENKQPCISNSDCKSNNCIGPNKRCADSQFDCYFYEPSQPFTTGQPVDGQDICSGHNEITHCDSKNYCQKISNYQCQNIGGTGLWQSPCSGTTPNCNKGLCECTPTSCGSGYYCGSNGNCQSNTCLPDSYALECYDDFLRKKCNAQGSGWISELCSGKGCEDNQCVNPCTSETNAFCTNHKPLTNGGSYTSYDNLFCQGTSQCIKCNTPSYVKEGSSGSEFCVKKTQKAIQDITPPTIDVRTKATTQNSATIQISTSNEPATCKYDNDPGLNYELMGYQISLFELDYPYTFILENLKADTSYTYYIKCQDISGNEVSKSVTFRTPKSTITQKNCGENPSYPRTPSGPGVILGKPTYSSNNPPTPNYWTYDTTAKEDITPCKWKCSENYQQAGNSCIKKVVIPKGKADGQFCTKGDECINDCIGSPASGAIGPGSCGKCSYGGAACSTDFASLSDIPSGAGVCARDSSENLVCDIEEVAGFLFDVNMFADCTIIPSDYDGIMPCDTDVFDTTPPYKPDGKCVSGRCQISTEIKPTITISKDADGICRSGEEITIKCTATNAVSAKVWIGECHGSDYSTCFATRSWDTTRRDAFAGKDDTYAKGESMTKISAGYTKTITLTNSKVGEYIAAACQAYGGSDYSHPSDWADAYPYCKVEPTVVAKLALKADCTSAPNNCDTNLYCTPSILGERHCCNTGQKWNGRLNQCSETANCDITINNVPTKPENRIINAIRNAANYIKGGKTSAEQRGRMREKAYGTIVGCSGDQVCCKANYGGVESYDCVSESECIKRY